MIQSKTCAHPGCSNVIHRPTGSKRITLKQWEERRFCGHICSGKRRLERDKVCSDPNCTHKGVKQSIKKFARDRNNPDGHKAQCYSCWKIKYEQNRENITPWIASPEAKLGGFHGFQVGSF